MPDPTTERFDRAMLAVENLVGPDFHDLEHYVKNVVLEVVNLSDPEFDRLCGAATTLNIHRQLRARNAGDIDRVLDAFDRNPKLLDSLILRLLERGDIRRNIHYLVTELGVKIAAPWEGDASQPDPPYWTRRHVRLDNPERSSITVAEVLTVEGDVAPTAYDWNVTLILPTDPSLAFEDSGSAPSPQEAMDAADSVLQTKGWILL